VVKNPWKDSTVLSFPTQSKRVVKCSKTGKFRDKRRMP
jgi:hypothetical protein